MREAVSWVAFSMRSNFARHIAQRVFRSIGFAK